MSDEFRFDQEIDLAVPPGCYPIIAVELSPKSGKLQIYGYLKDATQGDSASLVFLACSAVVGIVLVTLTSDIVVGLAYIFAVFGVHTKAAIIAALSLNSLFSALAAIPIYLVARNSFGSATAHWAGWGWAVFPYGVYFAAEWAWSTHLLLLCLFACSYC